MSGKRQMTLAKRAREAALKERRELKQEKKRAAAAAREARNAEGTASAPAEDEVGREAGAAGGSSAAEAKPGDREPEDAASM